MNRVEMNVTSGYVEAVVDYATCDDNYVIIDKHVEGDGDQYCIKYCFEPGKMTVVISKEDGFVFCAETFAVDNWTGMDHGNIVDWITRMLKPVSES